MKTTRGITLTALAVLTGACQDAPTFPRLEKEPSEAAVGAALEQGAEQAQSVLEEALARLPGDSVRPKPDRPRPDRDTTDTRRDPSDARPHRPARPDRPE